MRAHGEKSTLVKNIWTLFVLCHAVLRIRDPVPFWPLDPGSGIGFFRILYTESQAHIFESLVTIYWVNFYNSFKIGPKLFFLQNVKNKIIFNFVEFMATKKGMTTKFFFAPPSLLLLFLDPGWVKIRVRDPLLTSRICNTDVMTHAMCLILIYPVQKFLESGSGSSLIQAFED